MNLEGIGFVTLNLKGTFDVFGTLEGLSRVGLNIDLLPTGPEADPAPGDSISLTELPKGLRSVLQGISGRVVWRDGSRCGIAFEEPVDMDSQELENKLRDNHLLPWSMWAV